jgi:phospholipid N-methyltransferase
MGYSKINKNQVLQEQAKENWWKSFNFDLVFDIGASDGGFARKIKRIIPNDELHIFEALPDYYEKLIQKCGDFKNFHPINVAPNLHQDLVQTPN